MAYADDEAGYKVAAGKIPVAFKRLERALEKQGAGPFFNGAKYSLVDAAYAPFLQRYYFLDRIRPIGLIYPRLKAWAETLVKRPSTPNVSSSNSAWNAVRASCIVWPQHGQATCSYSRIFVYPRTHARPAAGTVCKI